MNYPSNHNDRASNKAKLFEFQNGKCCYCEREMILFPKMHGTLSATEKQKVDPRQLECTIEHLIRKAENGKNHISNYAASCLHCNCNRGNLAWNIYKQIRMDEVKMGLLA